jgi:AcrR family transcriptional regulator
MREESRARILTAALEMFAEQGYGGASMRKIAARAEISPGLIYAYFAGKEALLEAIFARSVSDVRESFEAADREPDPKRRVERLVRSSFEILKRNLDFWRLSYGVRMQAAILPGIADALEKWQGEIVRALTRYLRGAGVPKPGVEARVLFALIDGIAQHYVLNTETYPLNAVLNQMLARYGG